ncbi:MAG TPA: prolyl oligopeptidase family serine peptidase [Bryobacteraceae bacterium]|nr:prolyl oligopeptidase family serine peptidase [Bryobacteraceae bacterium]
MFKTAVATPLLALAALAARPPFTTGDLWAWRTATDARISPDGQWIAWVEGGNDSNADKAFSNLWLASADGKTRRPFTEGNWQDRSPRWSPDSSRIAWLSDRAGKPQILVQGLEAGAAKQLAVLEQPPQALAWSADGQSIAFTARLPAPAEAPPWAPPAILPWLVNRSGGFVHLFVIPAAGGAPRQISRGDGSVSGEPAWMPDGRTIVAAREDAHIWAFSVSGGPPRQLTSEPGRDECPSPSSDGARIAWLSTAATNRSHATRKLRVMNADGSRARVLSGSLDRDATDPQWSSDSRTVYFLAGDRGSTHVYAARADGTVRQATSAAERLEGFSLADNGQAVSVRSTASAAGDIYSFTVDRVSQPVRVAAPDEHLLAEREIAAVEEMPYESGGQSIQAWIVKPPGFDPAKKYPLLLEIRDDPPAMHGAGFNLRAQIAAARGFVVLCANPRGTPGYGETFAGLLPTRYPGDDYDDLMRGVDAVLAKGYVDPNRLTLIGGLLAAWTLGHTERFHRVVARRPVMTPAGLERAAPWDDPDQYVPHSPIFFARNFRTPTLVLAGDPDPESQELYLALQARKVESVLLRVPAAPTPGEQILELETVLRWLARP